MIAWIIAGRSSKSVPMLVLCESSCRALRAMRTSNRTRSACLAYTARSTPLAPRLTVTAALLRWVVWRTGSET